MKINMAALGRKDFQQHYQGTGLPVRRYVQRPHQEGHVISDGVS